jgi:hypothetical protein
LNDVPVRLIHNLEKQRPLLVIDYPIPYRPLESIKSENTFVSIDNNLDNF